MKQTYAVLLLLFVYSIANAQVKKGDIVLGGNLEFNNEASNSELANPSYTSKATGLGINPSIGKAIRDNLVLGLALSYNHSTQDYIYPGSTSSQTTNGFVLGVFIRRYRPIGAGFSLFGQAGLSGNYFHTDMTSPGTTPPGTRENTYGFALSLYPGIAYTLSRRWQIETGLPNFLLANYSHSKQTYIYTGSPEQTGTNHSFTFTSSLSGNDEFTVGVRYFIGG